MTLTTPHCPLGPQIIENVQRELTAIGASQVEVNIVWTPSWTPDAMTPELKKLLGIVPDEEEEEEPALVVEPPPPPAKKKRGLLGWLFRYAALLTDRIPACVFQLLSPCLSALFF